MDIGEPVVVIGNSGSATRVVTLMLRHLGMYLGETVGPKGLDSLWFNNWIAGCERWTREKKLRRIRRAMEQGIAIAQRVIEADPTFKGWGWKSTDLTAVLGEYREVMPQTRLLLIMRDPLDLMWGATTQATDQPEKYAKLYGLQSPKGRSRGAFTRGNAYFLEYWKACNKRAMLAGREMGDRFLLVRLEELIAEPEVQTHRIAAFTPWTSDNEQFRKAHAVIKTPESIGRWKLRGVQGVSDALIQSLAEFGYTYDMADVSRARAEHGA